MDYRKAFPSEYLKSSDFQDDSGQYFTQVWTISGAAVEDIGNDGERKLVLHFAENGQKMILNRTNADECGLLFGQDTDYWIGQPVKLHVDPNVRFGNKITPGLRLGAVDAPGRAAAPPTAPAPQSPPQAQASQAPAPPVAAPQFTMAEAAPSAYEPEGLQQMLVWFDAQGPNHPQRAEFQAEIEKRQAANRATIPAPPEPVTPAPQGALLPQRTPVPAYPDVDDDIDPFADA